MTGRSWALVTAVALISSGVWPFLQALVRRRPEAHKLDAEAISISVQGAEASVTILMRSLERAEERERVLEEKLAERERRIEALQDRLDHLSDQLHGVTVELEDARRQLAMIRD